MTRKLRTIVLIMATAMSAVATANNAQALPSGMREFQSLEQRPPYRQHTESAVQILPPAISILPLSRVHSSIERLAQADDYLATVHRLLETTGFTRAAGSLSQPSTLPLAQRLRTDHLSDDAASQRVTAGALSNLIRTHHHPPQTPRGASC